MRQDASAREETFHVCCLIPPHFIEAQGQSVGRPIEAILSLAGERKVRTVSYTRKPRGDLSYLWANAADTPRALYNFGIETFFVVIVWGPSDNAKVVAKSRYHSLKVEVVVLRHGRKFVDKLVSATASSGTPSLRLQTRQKKIGQLVWGGAQRQQTKRTLTSSPGSRTNSAGRSVVRAPSSPSSQV